MNVKNSEEKFFRIFPSKKNSVATLKEELRPWKFEISHYTRMKRQLLQGLVKTISDVFAEKATHNQKTYIWFEEKLTTLENLQKHSDKD